MTNSYRPDIDGLRAVAILLVISYHTFPNEFSGGFIGVDVFFVISGFLIGRSILKEIDGRAFTFTNFYQRRIKRIFPALTLILSVCIIFGGLALSPEEYKQLGKHIFGGSIFASNIFLWRESGYFDNLAETKPLIHLWSLGIEEQFYFLWPILMWWTAKLRKSHLIVCFLLIAFSFTINVAYVLDHPVAAFYLPFTRVWELASGSFLAQLELTIITNKTLKFQNGNQSNDTRLPPYILKETCSIIGITLIIISMFLITKNHHFPGWSASIPVLATCLIIGAGPKAWINRKMLSNPIMKWIGLISYPLYLWHWPILSFARIIEGQTITPWMRISLIALAIIVSWATYVFIEKPVREKNSKDPKNTKALVILVVIIGCVGAIIYSNDGLSKRFSGQIEANDGLSDDWEYPPTEMKLTTINGVSVGVIGGRGLKTLFYGDSNIQQYAPRVGSVIGNNPEFARGAVFLTTGGQFPADGVWRDDTGIKSSHSDILKLAESPEIDRVVIGAAWGGYFVNDKNSFGVFTEAKYHIRNLTLEEPEGAKEAFATLKILIQKLIKKNKVVYLVLGIPSGNEFSKTGDGYKDRKILLFISGGLASPFVPKALVLKRLKYSNDQLIALAKETGAKLIDPINSLCSTDRCPTSGHKDQGHLRASFVRKYVDYIDETLF